jgi:hypothetical protein
VVQLTKFSKSVFDPVLKRRSRAASGDGHTLRLHDLGMILAWQWNGGGDGGHSADVMNKYGWSRGVVPKLAT